jgi:hypothetical protein
MKKYTSILILFVGLLLSCSKTRMYTVYYKVEVQALDNTKPMEAKIAYKKSGALLYETIATGEWSKSIEARNGDNAFLRVYGIQNINKINVTVTVNNNKYYNTCNTLNCIAEIDQTVR